MAPVRLVTGIPTIKRCQSDRPQSKVPLTPPDIVNWADVDHQTTPAACKSFCLLLPDNLVFWMHGCRHIKFRVTTQQQLALLVSYSSSSTTTTDSTLLPTGPAIFLETAWGLGGYRSATTESKHQSKQDDAEGRQERALLWPQTDVTPNRA